MENPPKKYFRLYPGNEARLKGAYIIRCDGCEKDEQGNVTAVLCTVDMDTRNGTEGANRKSKAPALGQRRGLHPRGGAPSTSRCLWTRTLWPRRPRSRCRGQG